MFPYFILIITLRLLQTFYPYYLYNCYYAYNRSTPNTATIPTILTKAPKYNATHVIATTTTTLPALSVPGQAHAVGVVSVVVRVNVCAMLIIQVQY